MKPLFERTQGSENAFLGWSDNQLQRRPAIRSGAIGTSYLFATGDVVGPIASGITPAAIPWLFNDGGGSDISIDVGDPTKIDIATSGLYQIGFSGYPIGIGGGVTQITGYVGYVSTFIPGGTGVTSFTHSADENALSNGIFVGTVPWLIFLGAGDQVWVNVAVATSDASTWGAGAGFNQTVEVFRLA